MPPEYVALVQLGVTGLVLYLFFTDKLKTKAASDEAVKQAEERRLTEVKLWEDRYGEMRTDRNEWRKLALGTEKRLDVAAPTVATAIGVPVPSPVPAASEVGE